MNRDRMKISLENNKIYFETVLAVILTITSIIIAISANRITEAQKNIEEKSARPIIDISTEYDDNGYVSSVSIVNSGGLLDSLNVEIYPFWDYTVFDGIKTEESQGQASYTFKPHEAILPLYFPSLDSNLYRTFRPHTKSGVLFEIKESQITSELALILENLPDTTREIDKKAYRIDHVSMQYYLWIEYTDLVDGQNTTEAYCIDTGLVRLMGSIYYVHDVGVHKIEKNSEDERLLRLLRYEKDHDHEAFIIQGESYKEKAESMVNTAIDWYIQGKYVLN